MFPVMYVLIMPAMLKSSEAEYALCNLKSGMQENSKNLAKFTTEKQWWHARSASCYGQDFQ
jgi:hypothetical protein